MVLTVKAVEKLVKFSKEDAGTYRYVMSPKITGAQTKKSPAIRPGIVFLSLQ